MPDSYIELELFSTYIPYFNSDDVIDTVYRFFKEKPFYRYIVVLKEGKPIGILYKDKISFKDKTQNIEEFIIPLPKVKNTTINPEKLQDAIEILRLQVNDVFLVNAKNQYMGVINYDTLMHYLAKLPEAPKSKISNLVGKENTCFVLGFKDFKNIKEELGYKVDSLFKYVNDLLKNMSKECCVHIEKMENEIWSVHKSKLTSDIVLSFFEEFYKEYELLFKEHKDIILYGIAVDLSNIKSFKTLKERLDILKVYIKDIKNTVVIFDGLPPLLKTYVSKKNSELVQKIRQKIVKSMEDMVSHISKYDKSLWEFVAYDMFKRYPFYDLFYIMNENGIQISNNIINLKSNKDIASGRKGADRSNELYFKNSSKVPYITDVYLSKATDDFCITVSMSFEYDDKSYVMAGDISYQELGKINNIDI